MNGTCPQRQASRSDTGMAAPARAWLHVRLLEGAAGLGRPGLRRDLHKHGRLIRKP